MWLQIYALAFWTFAFLFILIRSIQKQDLILGSKRIKQIPGALVIVIKAIPTALATLFILFFRPSPSLFYCLMAVALFFCMLGDIGMEVALFTGIGLFAIAQIIFTITFSSQSLVLGISSIGITTTGLTFVPMVVFVICLIRYLQSSDQGLGKFRIPVILYAIVISLMLCTAILLWVSSTAFLGGIIVIGAIFFVISDSLFGVREFHHQFSKATVSIFSTYYLAIFLLSLNVLVFMF